MGYVKAYYNKLIQRSCSYPRTPDIVNVAPVSIKNYLTCFEWKSLASLSMNVVTKAAMVSPLYSSHHWFDDSLVKADHLAQRPTAALYNRTRNSL